MANRNEGEVRGRQCCPPCWLALLFARKPPRKLLGVDGNSTCWYELKCRRTCQLRRDRGKMFVLLSRFSVCVLFLNKIRFNETGKLSSHPVREKLPGFDFSTPTKHRIGAQCCPFLDLVATSRAQTFKSEAPDYGDYGSQSGGVGSN